MGPEGRLRPFGGIVALRSGAFDHGQRLGGAAEVGPEARGEPAELEDSRLHEKKLVSDVQDVWMREAWNAGEKAVANWNNTSGSLRTTPAS